MSVELKMTDLIVDRSGTFPAKLRDLPSGVYVDDRGLPVVWSMSQMQGYHLWEDGSPAIGDGDEVVTRRITEISFK